ncbi:tetratricopeptide repeat protein [Paracoccus saliphilus]|uniref:Sel1 repeat family protein n=1 Tax=Paracoccus saliphilus TaxID=405559 RepID=A0AA45W8I5_9RHOB|nr:tetratricopeptide repeat protein [Paracoccus saliphilus]WCR02628.1 sel1 repeat family protein [Paracoccus saliphilus]SIT17028.1 Sel1 repeat-containing protein [Paracoccus saliphilus]
MLRLILSFVALVALGTALFATGYLLGEKRVEPPWRPPSLEAALHKYDDKEYLVAKPALDYWADLGNIRALTKLGHMYSNGYGVDKDGAKAIEYYRVAVAKGGYVAAANLGFKYFRKDYPGPEAQLPEVPPEEIFRLLTRARNHQVSLYVQNRLGMMYYEGVGVPRDFKKARALFEEQVNIDPGFGPARYMLALMVRNGIGGPADPIKAVRLLDDKALMSDYDELLDKYDTELLLALKDYILEHGAFSMEYDYLADMAEALQKGEDYPTMPRLGRDMMANLDLLPDTKIQRK